MNPVLIASLALIVIGFFGMIGVCLKGKIPMPQPPLINPEDLKD